MTAIAPSRRRLAGGAGFQIGLALLVVPFALALFGPWMVQSDPYAQSLTPFLPPSPQHWLGTDQLGRDLFARLAYGGRASLIGAVAALGGAVSLGVILGALTAMAGRGVDALFARAIDALNGVPPLVVPIALVGAMGPGYGNLLIAVVLGFLPGYMRIARTLAQGIRHRPYVLAARMMGVGRLRIALGHIAEAVVIEMLVIALLDLGMAVTALAGLSFLGLGAQAPLPEWGNLLSDGQDYFVVAPWLLLFPAAVITCLVIGANLVGEALHDAVVARQGGFAT